MGTLRCTSKLLRRLQITDPEEPPPSANCLGDWFGDIVYTRHGHFVILVSERSLLPIITTARRIHDLVPRFLRDLRETLTDLDVPPALIDRELRLMQPVYFGRTNSRVVLGSMTDFTKLLKAHLRNDPETSLSELSLLLGRAPCKPIEMQSPIAAAKRLLATVAGFRFSDGRGP